MPPARPIADIGLELSSGGLTLARWERGTLQDVVTRELALSPESPEASRALLQELTHLVEQQKCAGRDAAITVAGEILLTPVSLPPMPEKEYRRAVELELHDAQGLDLAELELGLVTLRTGKDSEGVEFRESLAATLSRARATQIATIVQGAGLRPVVLMPSVQAMANVVRHAAELPPSPLLWVDVGYSHTTLGVFHGRQLIAVDELPFGYHPLLQQLIQPIQDKTGTVQLSAAEARELLAEHGIPIELTEERWLDKITPLLVVVALRPQLDRLVTEVKRSLNYVNAKFPEHRMASTILSGVGMSLPNLDRYLGEQLGLQCTQASQLKLTPMAKTLQAMPSLVSAGSVPAGAALAVKGQGLGLLPLEFRAKKLERLQWVSLRLTTVAALALLGMSYLVLSAQVRQLEQTLKAKQSEVAVLTPVKQLHERVAARQQLFRWISQTELPVIEVMKEVSVSIPKEVWLSSIAVDRQLKVVVLRGVVFASPEQPAELALAKFLGAMEESPFFSKINVTTIQRDPKDSYRSNFEATVEVPSHQWVP